MVTLADRLRSALDVRQRKPADLARACGVKPPSVSELLSGRSKTMKAETALKAAAYLRCNVTWLTTGVGLSGLDTLETAAAVVPLIAAEPTKLAPAWPLKRVTPVDLAQLTQAGLDKLEDSMLARIDELLDNPRFGIRQPVKQTAAAS